MGNDIKVVGIHHVQLAMPAGKEEEARAFYSGLLGLPEVPKPEASAVRRGAWFETDGVRIHLGVEAGFRPARKAHPALLVEDLDETVRTLRVAGVGFTSADPLDGRSRGHIADPFGNRIELIEAPERSDETD